MKDAKGHGSNGRGGAGAAHQTGVRRITSNTYMKWALSQTKAQRGHGSKSIDNLFSRTFFSGTPT